MQEPKKDVDKRRPAASQGGRRAGSPRMELTTYTMHGSTAPEAVLIERSRSGDGEAFERLIQLHLPRVYGLLFRLAGNHEDAEDLAQECFVRAWRSLEHYRGDGAFSTWLYRVALHLARDHARAARRRRDATFALETEPRPAGPAAPLERLARRELFQLVDRALQRLPHRLRSALVLRVFEGLEYDEIARIAGVTPGTARTHVMQARKLLLRSLEPWLGPGSGPAGGRRPR
jgi:RNA polymerase sigma-70 factor (ECF subfamily)